MSVNNITGNNLNQTPKAQTLDKSKVASNSNTVGGVKSSDKNGINSVSSTPEKDNITITASATKLRKMEDTIAQLPIVDTKKVEEVQKAIKDGSYSINPDKIASKLIEMELALSRK